MSISFTHPVSPDKIGRTGLTVQVDANQAECAALAERMQIPAVHSLHCTFTLTRDEYDGEIVHGSGILRASVTRVCVVSAEDFDMPVIDRFKVVFTPAGQEPDDADQDLPDPDADDTIHYENGILDLAEAAAEQLALALDPYPRMAGAVMPESDTDESPFAALSRLARPN